VESYRSSKFESVSTIIELDEKNEQEGTKEREREREKKILSL